MPTIRNKILGAQVILVGYCGALQVVEENGEPAQKKRRSDVRKLILPISLFCHFRARLKNEPPLDSPLSGPMLQIEKGLV